MVLDFILIPSLQRLIILLFCLKKGKIHFMNLLKKKFFQKDLKCIKLLF